MNAAFTNPNRFASGQAWLVSAGRVLASAEVAVSHRDRRTGLIGRSDFDGAFVIDHCRWVHTIGMKFPLDIAFLDATGTVIKTVTMGRFRVGAPVANATTVVEARSGSFTRWGLRIGDIVEVRAADRPAT